MKKVNSSLAAGVVLNRTFNRINDVLQEEGVHLVAGYGVPTLTIGRAYEMKWYEGIRTHVYKQDRPPIDWDMFVTNALEIYKAKNHDYKQAFTKGLVQFGRSVWAWEVHKKLNRIRTWIESGELRVKGEGVADSVNDIMVYTTIYHGWILATALHHNPLLEDTAANFYLVLTTYSPRNWLQVFIEEDLIAKDEKELLQTLINFLAGEGIAY